MKIKIPWKEIAEETTGIEWDWSGPEAVTAEVVTDDEGRVRRLEFPDEDLRIGSEWFEDDYLGWGVDS